MTDSLKFRKPVGVAGGDEWLIVVCDDGECYAQQPDGSWRRTPPIPGTEAAHWQRIHEREAEQAAETARLEADAAAEQQHFAQHVGGRL